MMTYLPVPAYYLGIGNNPNSQDGPKIAASANAIHVVWADFTPSDGDIFYKRSIDGGATFEPTEELSIDTQQPARAPALAVDGNNVYVVWQELTVEGHYEIFFRKSVDGGVMFSPAEDISESVLPSSFPSIAVHENNVYIVWTEAGEIFIKKSTDFGDSFGPFKNLSENSGNSAFPHIVVSTSDVFVIWSDDTLGNEEIMFRRSIDGGNIFGSTVNLSNTPGNSRLGSGYPIAVHENNVYISWYDEINPSQSFDILYRQSSDSGSTFGSTVNISNSPSPRESIIPSLAATENTVYIVWTEGPNREIEYRASIDPFSPSGLIDLTNNVGNSGSATIAVSS